MAFTAVPSSLVPDQPWPSVLVSPCFRLLWRRPRWRLLSLLLSLLAVPSYQAFQSQTPGNFSPLISGRRPTFASSKPVTESVSVTATRALGFQFTALLAQGFDTFSTHSVESSSVVGSLPFGQSVSQPPLATDPSPVLHFSLPTDGTPDEQYQCVIELVQAL